MRQFDERARNLFIATTARFRRVCLSGADNLANGARRIKCTGLMRRVDEVLQAVDVSIGHDGRTITNLTGHPKIILPKGFKTEDGFEMPRVKAFFGRNYDETTLLAVATGYQRATTGEEYQRPPLESFLKDIDSFQADEEYPDQRGRWPRINCVG